jgi:hypothetical protein
LKALGLLRGADNLEAVIILLRLKVPFDISTKPVYQAVSGKVG